MATKKKTEAKPKIFGQLTLGGNQALEWLTVGLGMVFQVISFGSVTGFMDKYDFGHATNWLKPTDMVCIVQVENGQGRDVLIHQKSALQEVERLCVGWEEGGASTRMEKWSGENIYILEVEDPTVYVVKRASEHKFAPYIIERQD